MLEHLMSNTCANVQWIIHQVASRSSHKLAKPVMDMA